MICERTIKKFCKDDISLIENYDKAIADTTQVWHCHHRRETIYSRSGLIEIGEYYNRPACELIFLTKSEHMRLHKLGKQPSEESRKKMSEAHKGKPSGMNGKHHSAETCNKISDALSGENHPLFGKHRSETTRRKISEAHKGKRFSESHKKKLSEALIGNKRHLGKHWYNNSVISVLARECPEGFVKGRIKK